MPKGHTNEQYARPHSSASNVKTMNAAPATKLPVMHSFKKEGENCHAIGEAPNQLSDNDW